MTKDEFLNAVQERLNLADKDEAETAVRSVLAATADRLTPEEANDLASQLPHELAEFIRRRPGGVQKMDYDTYIARIQHDLDLADPAQAERVARGVLSVVRDAVGEGEWQDVVSQMPMDMKEMFIQV
jgi:uncharacterized protein (DUF2267 family)